jgi:hypothetical protein
MLVTPEAPPPPPPPPPRQVKVVWAAPPDVGPLHTSCPLCGGIVIQGWLFDRCSICDAAF